MPTNLRFPSVGKPVHIASQRLIRENPRLKVVYMSGYSAEIAGKDLPLVEGVNFLTKPFATEKLAKIVRHCLDKN